MQLRSYSEIFPAVESQPTSSHSLVRKQADLFPSSASESAFPLALDAPPRQTARLSNHRSLLPVPQPVTEQKTTLIQTLAAFAGGALLKLLGWTLRVRMEDRAAFYDPKRKTPLILCIWHNRLLGGILGDYRARRRRPAPLSVLTSASKDGGWLAAMAKRFRMGNVRGSSSRRGAAALLELSSHLARGGDIAITPDGPRGPNYQLAPGIVHLAQRTGVRIVPVKIQIGSYWRIGRKWDALWIPKPFSRLTLCFLEPLTISPGDSALDAEGERLAKVMGAD